MPGKPFGLSLLLFKGITSLYAGNAVNKMQMFPENRNAVYQNQRNDHKCNDRNHHSVNIVLCRNRVLALFRFKFQETVSDEVDKTPSRCSAKHDHSRRAHRCQ
nr:MAG TPA: hypothetical protein [Caudoviricetes sp.]